MVQRQAAGTLRSGRHNHRALTGRILPECHTTSVDIRMDATDGRNRTLPSGRMTVMSPRRWHEQVGRAGYRAHRSTLWPQQRRLMLQSDTPDVMSLLWAQKLN